LVILDAPGGSVSEWISDTLTNSLWGVVPASGLVAIAVALLWAVFRRTNTGVALYAVGKDQTAAALSGINVKRTKCIAFVMAGSLYGLAGFMLSAQTASGVQSFYIGLFQGFVMIVAVILVNVITYLARRNRQHA
jgi:ribose transport system permease protein